VRIWALAVLAAVMALPAAAADSLPRIAFTAPGTSDHPDVVTIAPDGTGLQNLTPGEDPSYTGDSNPSWSPDNSQLVFESHRDSNVGVEIYTMNADGSHAQRLTTDGPNGMHNSSPELFNVSPVWSPHGNLIAWTKIVQQQGDIWVMNPDGTEQRRLTTDGGEKSVPIWSPDGLRLLYTRRGTDGTRIYTVGVDGLPPVALSPAGAADFGPVWSPDGTQIAFTDGQLYVMNSDGYGRQRITDIAAVGPAWSPDGSEIAFTGTRTFQVAPTRFGDTASRVDVFAIRPDGTGLRRLTGSLTEGLVPVPDGSAARWWPDGSRLFFVRSVQPNPPTTYEMNADGTCEGRFAPDSPALLDPAWQHSSQPGLGPIRCAELRLTGTSSTDAVGLGQTVLDQLLLENDGNETATGLQLRISAPIGATVAGSGFTCTGEACSLPDLPAGATRTLSVSIGRATAGPLAVTYSVGSAAPDPDDTDNSLQLGVTVLPCTLVGTTGPDVIHGTAKRDLICGRTGADRIYGAAGNDFIDAGNGDDTIVPGPGRDSVLGRGGRDVILARDGERDWIDCGTERDIAIVDRNDVVRHCEIVHRPPR